MSKINANRTNLGYLGEEFQTQLVKYFIETPNFFVKLVMLIDQNMFTDESLRRVVGIMKDRYNKVGICPNYADIELILRSEVSNPITLEQMLAKLQLLREMRFNAVDLITDNAEKFFKQQNLSKAINRCMEILKKGNVENYNLMEDLIRDALKTNMTQELGYRLFDDLANDLKEDYRCAIPTGATELDKTLYGGLGKGELGVIISPLGVGKTSCTTGFAAHAATCKTQDNDYNGYKVLHFYFEDSDVSIRRKYYGYVTNIDACDLSKDDIKPVAMSILADNDNELRVMLHNNIIARHLASGEVSASDIKYMIQQYICLGFVPDLVILDYFECLKAEKAGSIENSEWTREGQTMRKLEAIAHEFNIALWVPVQSTKGAIGEEIVNVKDAGGSVRKTQIGHVVITLAQTREQKENDKLTLQVGKLRAAKIGRTLFQNVKFNNGTCKFDFSELDSWDNEPNALSDNDKFVSKTKSIAKSTK